MYGGCYVVDNRVLAKTSTHYSYLYIQFREVLGSNGNKHANMERWSDLKIYTTCDYWNVSSHFFTLLKQSFVVHVCYLVTLWETIEANYIKYSNLMSCPYLVDSQIPN